MALLNQCEFQPIIALDDGFHLLVEQGSTCWITLLPFGCPNSLPLWRDIWRPLAPNCSQPTVSYNTLQWTSTVAPRAAQRNAQLFSPCCSGTSNNSASTLGVAVTSSRADHLLESSFSFCMLAISIYSMTRHYGLFNVGYITKIHAVISLLQFSYHFLSLLVSRLPRRFNGTSEALQLQIHQAFIAWDDIESGRIVAVLSVPIQALKAVVIILLLS